MAKSQLHFLGHVVDLLTVETVYSKGFNTYKGIPILYNQGGLLKFVFDFEANFRFLERMKTVNYDLYKRGCPIDDGKIVFYDANGENLKDWYFKDAPVVYYQFKFDANGGGMRVEMIISPAIQNYGCKIHRSWHITPIEEEGYKSPVQAAEKKEKKAFRINIEAKNSDIKNGLLGFDTIPNEAIVVSDYENLKREYKPLPTKILDKQYIPSWLSIRVNQTVELELDWDKKSNAKNYNTIAFEEHPDFSFEPKNLKGAKKIKITCQNNNVTPAQIAIKADNDLIVGALNIFYPKPKTIDLEWCFVEINEGDKENLARETNKSKLENYLNKGLNPALIDITITNNETTIIDIREYKERLTEYGSLKKDPNNRIGNYIERSNIKRAAVLQKIITTHQQDKNKLTVYFINQKCIKESDITEDGQFKVAGGISPTGTGIAYLVLDPGGNIKSENIIHEIMHALGLKHTFESKHKFKNTKTDNYMDYHNNKKHTYKWQWKNLHKYSKLK
ncbi:type VI secretion system tube protein TssD [Tenacibaculum sp. Bg11-29]|uniref:type VI secretion system tube protein TssD n=1 Tax=Tenacibaculum sp. Bg11-29 TaxID=2058306 RepID=UPI0012FED0AA|nr:type VI secretion system tube protein TssD [Tenacibaculum sp. Bg11-29]